MTGWAVGITGWAVGVTGWAGAEVWSGGAVGCGAVGKTGSTGASGSVATLTVLGEVTTSAARFASPIRRTRSTPSAARARMEAVSRRSAVPQLKSGGDSMVGIGDGRESSFPIATTAGSGVAATGAATGASWVASSESARRARAITARTHSSSSARAEISEESATDQFYRLATS